MGSLPLLLAVALPFSIGKLNSCLVPRADFVLVLSEQRGFQQTNELQRESLVALAD